MFLAICCYEKFSHGDFGVSNDQRSRFIKVIADSHATAVVVASSFNIPIFSQLWLSRNQIFRDDEFTPDSVYSPAAVNIPAANFEFLALPERIQLVIKDLGLANDLISRIIGGIVDKLPHTPFAAIGLNFNYLLEAKEAQLFSDIVKQLFMCSSNPLIEEFNSGNPLFGGYASKDMFDARIKLDMKPIIKDGRQYLLMNFNVHKDSRDSQTIKDVISNWSTVHAYIESLVGKVNQVF